MSPKVILSGIGVALIIAAFITILLNYFPTIGKLIIITVVAFIFGEIITRLIINGRKSPWTGHEYQKAYFLYILFFAAIVVSAIVGGALADYSMNYLVPVKADAWLQTLELNFGINFCIAVLVFVMFYVRTYLGKPK